MLGIIKESIVSIAYLLVFIFGCLFFYYMILVWLMLPVKGATISKADPFVIGEEVYIGHNVMSINFIRNSRKYILYTNVNDSRYFQVMEVK